MYMECGKETVGEHLEVDAVYDDLLCLTKEKMQWNYDIMPF